jgi:hypothetical protein
VRTFFFAGALAALITTRTAPHLAAASPPGQIGIYVGPAYYPTNSYYCPANSYYWGWGPGYYRPYLNCGY